MNSDLNVDRDEKLAAESQFARFASVCRPFAPIYRQMTVAAVAAFSAGGDISRAFALAYRDVVAAWRNYPRAPATRAGPFVLIGHSQGSVMLHQLIAREIESKPDAARMKLAIIPGFDVLVPQGKLVGGTLQVDAAVQPPGRDRLRHRPGPAFARRTSPPPGAMFGYSDKPGMTVGCVNPARPGSRDWVPLDSYWYARSHYPVPGGPISWSSEGPPPTALFAHRRPGLGANASTMARAAICRSAPTPIPTTSAPTAIGGEVGVLGMFLPGWGMHLADIPEAQGDLDPRGRRDQRSIQNSCSTLSPSAAASLIASVADGVNTPFRPC